MDDIRRWVVVLVLLFLFVVFVGYARGRAHHRGPQQVGAIAHSTMSVSNAEQLSDV